MRLLWRLKARETPTSVMFGSAVKVEKLFVRNRTLWAVWNLQRRWKFVLETSDLVRDAFDHSFLERRVEVAEIVEHQRTLVLVAFPTYVPTFDISG